ncbi:uncharacterized protein RSE6_12013 [Rhynchosporium secalis]|uniref:Uncharacterized protein n=1 Tax=Rhynchosporium secalis TaxID=38038 RepID=A0A1E1MPE2_RHYSE|nr:uncharacterized protein RSE6_12013 [Rhynchosporium secalis]
MNTTCEIAANSDVTGTGIRASIYTLCLASGILKTIIKHYTSPSSYSDFTRSLDSALQLQGLALLFTAIYQTFRQQLTLFHAICVLHILSLLGFGLTSKGEYGTKGRIRRIVLLVSQYLIAGAFLAFAAYIWITAPTFGSQPLCNASTIYVIFGVSINATEEVFRYVFLGLMSAMIIGAAIAMTCFGTIAACLCGLHRRDRTISSQDIASAGSVLARVQFLQGNGKSASLQAEVIAVGIRTGVNLYAIVTLEQTIGRNHVGKEERDWSFGQVLAIFMLVGVAVEVVSIFLARMDEKRKLAKGGDAEMAGQLKTNNQEGIDETEMLHPMAGGR